MDEVDGCGAGDKGGIQALIQVIKLTKTPIICICNDSKKQKLQSLMNHCYDLKFSKPQPQAVEQRVKYICKDQNLEVDQVEIRRLIEQSGSDLRQVINVLQMWKNRYGRNCKFMTKDEKVMINNFEAAYRLLNNKKHPENTIRNKLDLFFIDHDFVPLLVQDNYLNPLGDLRGMDTLSKMANAAEFISYSDLVSMQIRKDQNWALLGNYGLMSSVSPCIITNGISNYPGFPKWLGKNSSARKAHRLIRELKQKLVTLNCNKYAIQHEMIPMLLDSILGLLHSPDIPSLLLFMSSLHITPDLLKDHLLSKHYLTSFTNLPPSTKSSFTRDYNKLHKFTISKKSGLSEKLSENPELSDNSDNESDNEKMLDENEIAEIRKAKRMEEVRKKGERAMRKIEGVGERMVEVKEKGKKKDVNKVKKEGEKKKNDGQKKKDEKIKKDVKKKRNKKQDNDSD